MTWRSSAPWNRPPPHNNTNILRPFSTQSNAPPFLSELHKAAKDGNLAKVKEIFEEPGIDVNCTTISIDSFIQFFNRFFLCNFAVDFFIQFY